MPLSLQSIRELNKVHFYVSCCEDPATAVLSPKSDSQSEFRGADAATWSFGMYQNGGLSLSAPVESNQYMKGLDTFFNGWVSNLVMQHGLGMMPLLDYPRKFAYGGTTPIKFSLKCYLVLETDIFQDFYAPLVRLLFLTYPTRLGDLTTEEGRKAIVDTLGTQGIGQLVSQLSSWFEENSSNTSLDSPESSSGGSSKPAGGDSLNSFWQYIKSSTIDAFRGTYALQVPPPFMSRFAGGPEAKSAKVKFLDRDVTVYPVPGGTGIAMSYGSTYIPNVFFTGLTVSIPELYYEGGYPQVIELSLDCSTIRITTADSMFNALSGQLKDS